MFINHFLGEFLLFRGERIDFAGFRNESRFQDNFMIPGFMDWQSLGCFFGEDVEQLMEFWWDKLFEISFFLRDLSGIDRECRRMR